MSTYVVGGTDAGMQLVPYYMIAERVWPILPDRVKIQDDTAAGSFGLAWYRGRDPETGLPMFAVRDDFEVAKVPYVGFHEAAHELMTALALALARRWRISFQAAIEELRRRYWIMRGFPGTWQDAAAWYVAGGGWTVHPDESWADTGALVILNDGSREWCHNYGVPLDVERARAFLRELHTEAIGGDDVDEATTRRIAEQAAADAVGAYALRARETGFDPIKDAFNDHRHISVDPTRPGEGVTGTPLVTMGNEPRG